MIDASRARRAAGASGGGGGGAAGGSGHGGVATSEARAAHQQWLLDLTQLPTAAGREWRVVEWIRRWVADRPDLRMREDAAGNLVVEPVKRWGVRARRGRGPVFITAHLDHPAFVVERIIGPGTVELAFRGGVGPEYFPGARIVVHAGHGPGDPREGKRFGATITGEGAGVASGQERLFQTWIAEIDDADCAPDAEGNVAVGDVATWALPPAEIDAQGVVHTHACDDLAAAAAALAAYDALRLSARGGAAVQDVRLLFTRSEEIGFTGAIAACRLGTMPRGSRVIALENSRSFADSPIGGGPIVRVGDRLTIFSPSLTDACAKRAEQISGQAATARATEKASKPKWQRKLMAGGACEATAYCAYGYEATCLCLPLGNYHNMAHLDQVQAGTYDRERLGPPRVGREFISIDDYHGLVDLLVAIGRELPRVDAGVVVERMEKLYARHAFVLDEGRGAASGRGEGSGPRRAKPTKAQRPRAAASRASRAGKKPPAKPGSGARKR